MLLKKTELSLYTFIMSSIHYWSKFINIFDRHEENLLMITIVIMLDNIENCIFNIFY